MTFFPDWNSLESVSRTHDRLEIAGFVLLGLLAVIECFQFIYGHRKDDLSTIANAQQLSIAKSHIARLENRGVPWRLSPQQRQILIASLSPYKGQEVRIERAGDVPDGAPLTTDLVDALTTAGWICSSVGQADYYTDPIGVVVVVKQPDALQSANILATEFVTLGLASTKTVDADNSIDPNVIEIHIGKKPE